MKTTNKVFLVGMISVVLAFGFVFTSCSQVFEGTDDVSGKPITLKLKSSSYEIKFDGKTFSGDATKISLFGIDTYSWTSGGTGSVVVQNKKATAFTYSGNGVTITAFNNLSRSVIADGEISLDDIELIIEE